MRAFVLEKYGDALASVDMPDPVPGPNEVLVRMVASGVNHVDERTRAGQLRALFRPKLPKVMGSELAGEVISVGSAVTGFAAGDRVYAHLGVPDMGSFAEVVAVDAAAVAHAPSAVSFAQAASLPVSALTAWRAFTELSHVRAGQTVLVHGGAGSVGAIAIQLAKHLGATVATTASAANADFVRELGADIVIDYRSQDFVESLAGTPVDVVLDTQGGDITTRSLRVLRRGGIVVGIAGTPDPAVADEFGAGRVVKLALGVMSFRLRRQARALGVSYRFLFIQPDGQALRAIAELVDAGAVRPAVGRVLPFSQTVDALQQILGGGNRGKVLVAPDPDEATAVG